MHRRGIGRLAGTLAALLPHDDAQGATRDDRGVRVCIIGRPNTGKSTLVNRLAGDERVLAHDLPGTTRDSVEVPFEHDGRRYVLIDTAGIRRRSRVSETIEKFSVVKALAAIADSDVAIVVLDASAGMSDQDTSLLGTRARWRESSGHRVQQVGSGGRAKHALRRESMFGAGSHSRRSAPFAVSRHFTVRVSANSCAASMRATGPRSPI